MYKYVCSINYMCGTAFFNSVWWLVQATWVFFAKKGLTLRDCTIHPNLQKTPWQIWKLQKVTPNSSSELSHAGGRSIRTQIQLHTFTRCKALLKPQEPSPRSTQAQPCRWTSIGRQLVKDWSGTKIHYRRPKNQRPEQPPTTTDTTVVGDAIKEPHPFAKARE
jgi:hypothetical protein